MRVIGRHWIISSSGTGTINEVPRGSHGVVGHTPEIAPGEAFYYGSGTSLDSPRGQIYGSLQIITGNSDDTFDALIAPVDLEAQL